MEHYSFDAADLPILVEVTPAATTESSEGGRLQDTSRRGDKVLKEIKETLAELPEDAVRNIYKLIWIMAWHTGYTIHNLKELEEQRSLSNVDVEFGLSFNAEGSIYFTKLSGAANIAVKMKWEPKNDDAAST